jgi:hypothetical protein
MRALGLIVVALGLVACTSTKKPDDTGSNQTGVVCGSEVCPAHASCNGTACVCDQGFEKLGTLCVDVNECLVNHGGCDPHASCVNTPGSFECKCRHGYEGDGSFCYETGSDTGEWGACGYCDPNATCETNEETQEAYCLCKEGYSGTGRRCSDINECTESDCDANATCTNLPGSRSCTCNSGYYGDGKKCSIGSDHAVGASCSMPGSRSDCDNGLTCRQVDGTGFTYCSKAPCTTNADCGKNGTLQNVCLNLGDGTKQCLRVCDPGNPGSCGREGWVCSPQVISSRSYNLCTPDCRLDPTGSACPYGTSCGSTTGVCEKKSCAGSNKCGAGEVCVTEGGTKVCVTDCRITQECPADRICKDTTGGCEVPKAGVYEPCGTTFGECDTGLVCVVSSSTSSDGVCMQKCTTNGNCTLTPAGKFAKCVDLDSGAGACIIDCSSTSCPNGTTCKWIYPDELCLP